MKRGDKFIAAAVLILSGLAFLFIHLQPTPEGEPHRVVVEVENEIYREIPLPVEEKTELQIPALSGREWNLLRVKGYRVQVLEATCPDQICVNSGWIEGPHQQLICLPNRVLIYLDFDVKKDDGVDIVV